MFYGQIMGGYVMNGEKPSSKNDATMLQAQGDAAVEEAISAGSMITR